MQFSFPILLDVRERSIVIVGGGEVAARKVRALLSAGGSRLRVVAPEFHEPFPAGVGRVPEAYREQHLEGADLVFAATHSPEVNTRVVQDARKRSILVSRVDEDQACAGDFILPAVHRDGPVTVAVSAGSAALSAAIRDGIAGRFDARWTGMAEIMRHLRPRVREHAGLSAVRRRAIFRELTGEAAFDVAGGGAEDVWKWLVSKYPELENASPPAGGSTGG
jgi:precorrin-2 dehydrogenase / sirohydrochlorin ferrochelatase